MSARPPSTDQHRAERKAIQVLMRRAARQLRPELDKLDPAVPEHVRQALIAQNVMRICLETVLRETLPYEPMFLTELGTRLAAYCVTAGPPWQENLLIELIQQDLPGMVELKQKSGTGIKADWESAPER